MPAIVRRNAPRLASFALVALATFAFAVLAHASVDPADAGASAASGTFIASLAAPAAPVDAAPAVHDVGMLLGIATAIGLFLRSVVIPLLKSSLFGALFNKVPLFAQHLIVCALAAAAGALVAYGRGEGIPAALVAGITAYGSSQAAFGLTANAIEFRAPKA
jgi:hypothetical protein